MRNVSRKSFKHIFYKLSFYKQDVYNLSKDELQLLLGYMIQKRRNLTRPYYAGHVRTTKITN
jgi:hypothetical protein